MKTGKLLLALALCIAAGFASEAFTPNAGTQQPQQQGNLTDVVGVTLGGTALAGAYFGYRYLQNKNNALVHDEAWTYNRVPFGVSWNPDTGQVESNYLQMPQPKGIEITPDVVKDFFVGGIEDFIANPSPENAFWAALDVFAFVPGVAFVKAGKIVKVGKTAASGLKISPKVEKTFLKQAVKVKPTLITPVTKLKIQTELEKEFVKHGIGPEVAAKQSARKTNELLGFYFTLNNRIYLNSKLISNEARRLNLPKKVVWQEVTLHERAHWTLIKTKPAFTKIKGLPYFPGEELAADILAKQASQKYGKTLEAAISHSIDEGSFESILKSTPNAAFEYLRAIHVLNDVDFALEIKALIHPADVKKFNQYVQLFEQEALSTLTR